MTHHHLPEIRRWGGRLAILALLLMPITAHASAFKWIGYDSSAVAGANADYSWGESYGVLYSNPALMSRFAPHSGVDFTLYKPSFKVNVGTRPANADVPMQIYEVSVGGLSASDNPDRALPTIELTNKRSNTRVTNVETYLGAGFTYDFGLEGFRVGGMATIPVINALDAALYYSDEREQYFSNQMHFARFGEWSPIITGMFGVSYSPIKYISLGVSLQVSAALVADLNVYIPEATVQDYMLVAGKTTAVPKFRPIVGIHAQPLDWFTIGMTWRNESYIKTDASGGVNLWNFHESVSDVGPQTVPMRVKAEWDMALDYEPMEVSSGLGFMPLPDWKIQAGLTWNRWSKYRDIHYEHPEEAAVFQRANSSSPAINGNDYKWFDTLSVNMNTSYRYVSWSEGKLGFAWNPSPVPTQKGRTNYADSDTWGLSMGNRFDFGFGEDWQFYAQIGLQFWQMLKRTVNKDPNQIRDEFPDHLVTIVEEAPISAGYGLQTNNPGFPSYSQYGWMFVTSVSFHYEF